MVTFTRARAATEGKTKIKSADKNKNQHNATKGARAHLDKQTEWTCLLHTIHTGYRWSCFHPTYVSNYNIQPVQTKTIQ